MQTQDNKKRRTARGTRARTLASGALALLAWATFAGRVSAAEPLFTTEIPSGLSRQSVAAETPRVPGYVRTHRVRISPPMLQASSPLRRQSVATAGDQAAFELNLFDDRSYTVVVTKTRSRGAGQFVTYGKVAGSPESLVILSVNDGTMAGSVSVPGENTTKISYAGDGYHIVGEIDPQSIPPCGSPGVPLLPPTGGEIPATAGDVATRVDAMVLYTAAARAGAGGTSAMQALVALAIAEANEAYGNSGISVELNLVYQGEVTYTETGVAATDLSRLQTSGDGHLDTAQTLRSQYGADVVVLITESMATYAGLAYVMSPPSSVFSSYAYGVVKREYASGSYVFPHEVGHIFGCQHDHDNSSTAGAYSYSYGHRFNGTNSVQYRTVMAYAPGTRIPYFSNPNVTYQGTATGVASGPTAADNTQSINNTAATVAGFAGQSTFVQFELTSTNVTETNVTLTFNVTREGDTNVTSTVQYSTSGISATGGSDYTALTGNLSFAPGETNQTIDLMILDDSVVEADEVVRLILANPTNAVLGINKTLDVTINDDDIGVTFTAATASVSESGTNVTVNVKRTGDSSPTVTVDYLTADLSATAGSDYTATNGTLSFGSGVTNLTITVPILTDASIETNETFSILLTNATGGTLLSPTNMTVTILEVDSSIEFTTNAVATSESSSSVSLTVRRTGGTNSTATIEYLTIDSTAAAGSDYTSTNGTLTFSPGVATRTITIPILNDTDIEGTEAFSAILSNVVGATIGTVTNATVSIEDNDSSFEFDASTATVIESAKSVTLTVIRTGGSVGSASVRYSTADGSALNGSDYTAKSGILSFSSGQTNKTLTITIKSDNTYETNETFTVSLSDPVGEASLGTVTNITVTIQDNVSYLQLATNTVSVAENAGTVTLNVLRTGQLAFTNTVRYTARQGTARYSDFVSTNGTLTFNANDTIATITIGLIDDTEIESAEDFSVQIYSPTGGAIVQGDSTAVITITENDVGLAFNPTSYSVSETGTNVTLTVVQTGNTNATVSVNYATSDLTALAGSDYTSTNGTLNFGSGTNSLTIVVPITNDSTVESNETFRVSLSSPSGAILQTASNVVVTILEDDAVIALATNAVSFAEDAGAAAITVWRTGGTNTAMTVDYFTTNGTGTNAVDYTGTNATVTFGPGVKSATISVPILNNTSVDGDRTFSLTLTNATGAALGATTNATVTILDNDSTFNFETNAVMVAETSGSLTLSVLRAGGLVGAASVRYATADGSAVAGSDYTARSGILSFKAGETNKTISIPIRNDTDYETNETFTVALNSPAGEGLLGTNATITVTITDNDSILQFATNAVTVSEGAGSVSLDVSRTGTLTTTNTVRFTVRQGTARYSDFVSTNGTLTFNANETNATITIALIDDTEIEESEQFTVQITSPTGGALIGGDNTAVVTIAEDDVGLAFSATSYSVSESGTNATLTVVQTGNTNATVSVDYATSDLTATAGSDYTSTNGTLNFGAGTNSLTITVPITGDSTLESNETFRVSLSNPSGAILQSASNAVVTILEDEAILEFSTNAFSFAENAWSATVTVLRLGGTNTAMTVDYFTTDGTGTNAVDYTGTNSTLTFIAGANTASISVPIINNSSVDGDRTFTLTLTNATGAALGTTTNATVTILDNDSTFEFETNAVTMPETASSVLLTVVRAGGMVGPATVRYATADGTAVSGTDYTTRSGLLSFKAGETNKTISVPIRNDKETEEDETFTVALSSPTDESSLGTNATITVTLTDNDSILQFVTNAVSVAENAGTVTLTVARTGTLTTTNTIRFTVRQGTARYSDFVSTNGTITFNAGETNATISVTIIDDTEIESAEEFSVQLSSPTGGALLGDTNIVIVTITENDVGLEFVPASYSVGEAGTNVTLTVVQTGNTNATVSVDYATADLTAEAGSDYTSTNGTLNFGTGTNSLTIVVPITSDSTVESNETFRVSLSNPSGAILQTASNAVVTILEDDAVIALATNAFSFAEDAGNALVTVLRTGGTNSAMTVDYFTADGTGTNAVDYTGTNATVTFIAGANTATISVPILNNSSVDGDRTFSLTLTNASGAMLGSITNGVVTILDNDSTFQFDTNAVAVSETDSSVSLSVVRAGGLVGAASVRYATADGTATAGSDYTARSGLLSFKAGETNKIISIPIRNDKENETNETFTVALNSPTDEATLGTNSTVTVTISDNDSLVHFETNAVTVSEGAGTVSLNVVREGTLTTTNTVRYTVRQGTARYSDFTATSGTLTFNANETNATIVVSITDDTEIEGTEEFTVQISSATGGALITGDSTAVVTITENDVGLEFSPTSYSVSEAGTNITLTVVQTGDTNATVSVDYATADVTAASGADYTSTNGTLNFGAGTNSLTIVVAITSDSTVESNETFRVSLSNPSGAMILSGSNAVATILEDDALIALATNAVSFAEDVGNASVTVLRTGGTNTAMTVDYFTSDGTGTNAVDYTGTNSSLTFAAGANTATISIPILNNSSVDGDRTFSLTLTNASGAALGSTTNITVTILDNDSVFQFDTNAVTVSETDRTVLLTAVRSGGLVGAATVLYATSDDSATAGSDYNSRSGLLSFKAFETNKQISITLRNDTVYETNEAFNVTLSSPTGEASLGSNSTVAVTIVDDDSVLSFETNAVTVAEGAGTVSLNVRRTGTLTTTNTLRFIARSGTAKYTDFTATNGVLTFNANETNATITISITDDSEIESSETFTVVLASPTGGAIIEGDKVATITITENDVGLEFAPVSYSVSESGTNVTLTVVQTGDTNATVSVDYATADLTAEAGSDYTSTNGTLNFGAGTNSLTITVPVTADSTVESNETFRVSLSNPTGATLLSGSNAVVTILEDDAILTLATNAVSFAENAGNAIVTVLRTGGTNTAMTVDYFTTDGTGTNAVDYTGTNTTLTFAPGENTSSIAIPILNNSSVDGDRTFSLTLTNATGAALGATTNITVSILDNDSVFEFETNAVTVSETSALTLTVLRSGGIVASASVRYATADGTAVAGSDYTSRSGLLSFKAGETNKSITIPIRNDTENETNETFTVTLSNPTDEATIGSNAVVTATISDNDSLLSFVTNAVTVSEGAGTVTLNIQRTGTLTTTNTLRYTIRPGTARSSSDYSGTNGVLTFNANDTNATITISIVDDTEIESSEYFSVQISSPTGGALISGTNMATITITENDAGLEFVPSSYSVSEAGTNVTLTVVQTGDTNATVSVDYTTTDLTAEAGSDYTSTNGTLNFGAGTNSLTIVVPITSDTTVESNETFRVSLTNPTGAILQTASNAIVTILEDDTVIELSTNAVAFNEDDASATFTVYRTGGTNVSVSVDYFTTAGTATNGVDFVSTNATLTIGAGVNTVTVTVPLLNDSAIDGDKTFSLSLTNASGAALGAITNSVATIYDNDSIIDFSTNAVTVMENERSVTLTAVRSGGLVGAASVLYATSDGSALNSTDYTARSGLLSFKAGETNKIVTITIRNDTTYETNETFNVTLSSPTGEAALSSNSTAVVTIVDEDSVLSLETNAVTVAENAGSVTLNVRRTGTLTTTNTLRYTARSGTAKYTDFTATSGILTFLPNETNAAITINITDDNDVEPSETFSVVVSSPTGGAILEGDRIAYVTITEDDIGLAFSSATYEVAENATNVVLTVVQTGDTNATVSVGYTTADVTAEAGSDYTSTNGTLNFGPGTNSLTITVPILDDSALEVNETFNVVLASPTGGAILLANSNAVVRILEDDSSLEFSTNAVSVLETVTKVTLTVIRNGGTNFDATVDLLTLDGTASSGSDYTSTNTTLSFTAGVGKRTVTVLLANDSLVEGDETFTAVLTNFVGSDIGANTNLTVTILDNDSVIGLSTNAVSVSEAAGVTSLNLMRTGGVAAAASVRYYTTNGTATSGSDFRGRTGTIRFSAGETNKTISIIVINDTEVETNETFAVVLHSPTGEATIGTNTTTLTIIDNDFAFGGTVVEAGTEPLAISALDWDTNSCPMVEVVGPLGAAVNLQGSSDLTHWDDIAHGVLKGGPMESPDPVGRDQKMRFYRIVQPAPVEEPAE